MKIFSKEKKELDKRQKGAAMLVSIIFFIFISLAVIMGLTSPVVREFKNTTDLIRSKQSYALSESGVEDAYYRIKNALTINSPVTITLNNNTVVTTVVDSGTNEKTITSVGDVSNRDRITEITLSTGEGVSFSYGIQSGFGGLTMGNNSVVNGSVYSNGPITGSGSITGTAASANSASLYADQSNGSGTPLYDVTFGNANGTQDFAQSFQLSTTDIINKAELYLKKTGTPSNLTVRIVNNSSGVPGTTTLASGTLSASLVSTNYGWVSIFFSSNPQLTAGTTYWLVVDGSTNSSRYYFIGANDNGYGSGAGKIGQQGGTWNSLSPSTLDGFFKVYLGGLTGSIDGILIGSAGVGDAYAHTVNNSIIAGTNFCQTGTGNNKSCNTSLPDPTPQAMPVSDQNILDWKAEAEAGGTTSGNFTVDDTSSSLGPRKITGNMTITNNASLTVNGTIWVQGNLTVSNNANISLSSTYSSSEGVIIVDGVVDINNNSTFSGSGTTGSYLMVLSTSTSTSAISLANNGGAVILYAANGTVNLANNAQAKALNGYIINLSNNVSIIYDSGLINSNFVNGPSGGWNINEWKETE